MDDFLAEMLKRHEGLRLNPYRCTAGKLTIGYGRNLDDVGISEREADILLKNDIAEAERLCLHAFSWFRELSDLRKAAMVNLCFNMGMPKLMTFKNFLACMASGDYESAATHLLNSRYAQQVKQRAVEVANLIRGSEEV